MSLNPLKSTLFSKIVVGRTKMNKKRPGWSVFCLAVNLMPSLVYLTTLRVANVGKDKRFYNVTRKFFCHHACMTFDRICTLNEEVYGRLILYDRLE